ncbi:MAG: 3'-5' exonuclease, partial [bacterium]|nr:3'-5' exonuclease [bacterium]
RGTFHSFSDTVLKSDSHHIGVSSSFSLMAQSESVKFLKEHLFDLDLKYFRPLGNPGKFVQALLGHFSRLKDEDITPEEYLKFAKTLSKKAKSEAEKLEFQKTLELATAYEFYEKLKLEKAKLDFADLISCTLKLFRERPNVLEKYHEQFKYILFDEFQDTNIAQNELIKLLAGKNANLTAVCDDDQSIYKWRGASTSNVLQFRKTYPKSKIITLTKNYRSTQEILDNAYKLIQNNNPDRLEVKEKIDKRLVSQTKKEGEKTEFLHADRVENEAEIVAKKILQLIKEEKRDFSDFAILVRANNHSEPFIRSLARFGIPYQFLGPGQLFQQPEVKDLIAYLKVLVNYEDSASFYKVLCMDYFALPPKDLASLTNYAKKFNMSLFEAAEKIEDVIVTDETKTKVKVIAELVHKHLRAIPKSTAGQILYDFLERTEILKSLGNPKTSEDEKRVLNISKFFNKLKNFESSNDDSSVFAVVDWIDLAMDLGESPASADFDWSAENAVNILTIHGSKGLEFPVVFVVNLVSERFPTRARGDALPIPEALVKEIAPAGDYHLQEERRLFYVAITRAKERLYLTASDYYGDAKRQKKISPFVVETLGEEVLTGEVFKGEQLSFFDANMKDETPPVKVTKPKAQVTYLSYSQIDTFNFCPMHYKLKYILGIPSPASPALSFGVTMHQTLKDFSDRLIRGEKAGEKELLELYNKNWLREGYSGKTHEEQMKKRGVEYLSNYLKSKLHNTPLAVEQPFSFFIGKDLKIGGKIDRIDKTSDGIEIIDYKTTDYSDKELPSANDLAKDLQLSIYGLAAAKVKHPLFDDPNQKVTLSLYLLDKGEKASTTRSVAQLEKTVEEILQVRDEIQNSQFLCSGNFFCKDCEMKMFCEVKN